jgi:hypothetical protein
MGENMLKKLLVTAIAAGALSVPFAALAGADPAADNPGLPGNLGGLAPGTGISGVAKQGPGVVADFTHSVGSAGSFVKQGTPGHNK